MIARDSAGRSVSLLNDVPDEYTSPQLTNSYSPCHSIDFNQSYVTRSNTSSPTTPNLTRADSCDASFSPKTPTSSHEFNYHIPHPSMSNRKDHLSCSSYDEKAQMYEDRSPHNLVRTTGGQVLRNHLKYEKHGYKETVLIEDESCYNNTNSSERAPKRYPCRFRDSHHCQKTFTTSGHASRHSKIHTAEKGVSCSWPGCQKKFTRSDNMKQHLETHTKERSRISKINGSNISSSSLNTSTSYNPLDALTSTAISALTVPAGVKKASIARRVINRNVLSDPHVDFRSRSLSLAVSPEMRSLLDPVNLDHLNITVSNLPQHTSTSSYHLNGLDTLALAAGTHF